MQCRTDYPVLHLSIGAEGMSDAPNWPGYLSDTPKEFAERAIALYLNEEEWNTAQQKGFTLLETVFDKNLYVDHFKMTINSMISNLVAIRNDNFIGNMLQHHTMQSSKYLSRWIEEKNK